ncbi:MAG TPA: hypothetical protein VMT82_05340 [candidate division Zixibacteria bacterium]|nr:hypothetical protein [candidate division Zixibacteria bacterium]
MPERILDKWIPRADHGGRHEITVRAPASVVMHVARNFEMQSIWAVRAIISLRARILGGEPAPVVRKGLLEEMYGLGWAELEEDGDRFLVAGAACQPWNADPAFDTIPREQFCAYAEPDRVKIAWTLEAEPLGPYKTRFATETRAVATDQESRRKFGRYWRRFGIGIVLIRMLLLPAMRRQAERRCNKADE